MSAKNKNEIVSDLKKIYIASSKESTWKQLKAVTKKWDKKYLNAIKSQRTNWDVSSPIFKFSEQIGKIIYTTTNAIESLNSCYLCLDKRQSIFPSDTTLLKVPYPSESKLAKSGQCRLETAVRCTSCLRSYTLISSAKQLRISRSVFRCSDFHSTLIICSVHCIL